MKSTADSFLWKSIEAARGSDWDLKLEKRFKLGAYGTFWVFIKQIEEARNEVESKKKKKKSKESRHRERERDVGEKPYKRRKGENRSDRLIVET